MDITLLPEIFYFDIIPHIKDFKILLRLLSVSKSTYLYIKGLDLINPDLVVLGHLNDYKIPINLTLTKQYYGDPILPNNIKSLSMLKDSFRYQYKLRECPPHPNTLLTHLKCEFIVSLNMDIFSALKVLICHGNSDIKSYNRYRYLDNVECLYINFWEKDEETIDWRPLHLKEWILHKKDIHMNLGDCPQEYIKGDYCTNVPMVDGLPVSKYLRFRDGDIVWR